MAATAWTSQYHKVWIKQPAGTWKRTWSHYTKYGEPHYPVPALYHVDLDEEMHGMVFAHILFHARHIFYTGGP